MANEEVSNIGVKLSLDASNFSAGLGTAQGKLNSFQQQAAKAASGAGAAKAGAGSTPTTIKVAIEPAQLQAALSTAAKTLQTIHVPIDVDSKSIATMRTKITEGLGTIPVQVSAQFPKTGPGSPQAIIGTVFSSMGGMSPQKGQILARQAIEQIMPKREHGGPVQQGRPTIVGERRPEVFRPGASGFIEKDVAQYRRHAAELAALEYQIMQRQKNIQHAFRGARTPMLPPGTDMPAPLGTLPVPPGYARGYHSTRGTPDATASQVLAQIRQQGMRLSSARGHTYGEPDMNWFSGDKTGSRGDYGEKYAVEAFLPEHWFDWNKGPRGRIGNLARSTRPYTIGGPSSNMGVGRDISRRRFSTYNEPWMHHTRYMQERAAEESPGRVMRQIGSTISGLRGDPNYGPMSQGYDQFVAESWRARHRGYGGEVTSLYGGDPEALEAAAIKHYGVTENVREAGFITPSGKFLDFSGRHVAQGYTRRDDRFVPREGKPDYLRGQRSIDHRESADLFPGLDQAESVERMKSLGFIRVWGTNTSGPGSPLHSVGAEMTRLPTTAQISKLVGAARESLHASVDVYDPMGYQLPGGNFRTEWPEDPMGGKRMGSFIRQAMEMIEKNDSEADEIRQSLGMHRCVGGAVHANAGCVHRGIGGSVEAGMTKRQRSYLRNVRDAAKRMLDPGNPYGRQSLEMGVQWYPEAQKWIQQQADMYGLPEPTVRGITASLSAGTAWSSNKTKAVRILQANQAGKPFPYQTTLDAHRKAKAILEGADPWAILGHTPKVGQFFLNTGGDLDAITIDRWALRTGTQGAISQAGRGPVRTGVEKAFRTVAKDMGIPPVSLQAALWIQEKAETDLAAGRTPKLAKYMAAGGSVVPHAGFLDEVALTAVGWANDPFMAMMAWQASQAARQHRAAGGRVLKPIVGGEKAASMRSMPEWYQALYSGRGRTDYTGRSRLAQDFVGPYLDKAREISGAQDWWDMMSGDYPGPFFGHNADPMGFRPMERVGAPMLAAPGMQDMKTLEAVTRSMALGRFAKTVKHHAAGGPTGRGLYIVNEQGDGSEGFVAGRDAHLIPKFVMDRIPGARDGAKTGMINKPANSFFSPEQDGIIVPKWAVPYVGALRGAASGWDTRRRDKEEMDRQDAAKARRLEREQAAREAYENPAVYTALPAIEAEEQEERRRVVAATIRKSRAGRGAYTPDRENRGDELSIMRAGAGKVLPSRTPGGAIAAVSSFLFGGVKQMTQAERERVEAQTAYNKAFTRTNTLVGAGKAAQIGLADQLQKGNIQQKDYYEGLRKVVGPIREAKKAEAERLDVLTKATAKTMPTNAGIVRNLGVIIAATSGYGLAMQAASAVIQPAIEGTIKATQSFMDGATGFSTSAQQVTKTVGESARQMGGNVEAALATALGQGGIGTAGGAFAQQYLTGGVLAKGGGAAAQQGEDVRKGIIGSIKGAPEGLFGGYGGVGGGALLAEVLGGGKGAVEIMTKDLMTITNEAKKVTPMSSAESKIGAYVGNLPGMGPGGRVGYRTPPTPQEVAQGPVFRQLASATVRDYNQQARRYTDALGEAADGTHLTITKNKDLLDQMKNAADAQRSLGGKYADYADRVDELYKSGTVLLDANGKVVTSMQQATKYWQNVAGGAMTQSPEAFAAQQARGMRAQLEVLSAQTAQQLSIGIPGQMGMELAGHPFLDAAAGVLPPGVSAKDVGSAPGGINIAKTLTEAQSLQNDLTLQGKEALKNLSDWIGKQPGMQGPYSVGIGVPTTQVSMAPTAPGVQYTAPIGPGVTGAPLPSTSLGMAAPTTVGGQTFKSGQAAFDYFTGQMQDAGKAIAGWQTKIVNTQTAQQWAQFTNNLRLANRSYADALALAGRGGGGRGSNGEMGGLERQQTMLGFMLTQKQINFQTAMAGFQAPGLTSEERGARQAQAEAEARIAQKQLNIQERMFTVGASRGVTDTGAAVKLIKSEQAAQVAIAAAQKAIAAQQMKLSQAQSKAQAVLQQAEGGFTGALGQAGQFAAQFGGAVQTAVKVIYTSLGFKQNRGGGWYQAYSLPSVGDMQAGQGNTTPHAAGFLGSYARGAVLQVGEAGPETVAILRNPRSMMMGGGFGGGGGGPISVNLYLTVQGDVSGEATVARIVRAVEDSFNRKAARLGMRGLVSATGG